MNEKLISELRSLRKSSSLTLREVETRCGVSNAYLSQLENGTAVGPSPKVLQKLASAYGVPHERLMRVAGYIETTSETSLIFGELKPDEIELLRSVLAIYRSKVREASQ